VIKQKNYGFFVVSAAGVAIESAGLAIESVAAGAGVSTGATAAESVVASSLVSPPPHEVNVAAIIAIAKNFFIVVFFWFKIIICGLIPHFGKGNPNFLFFFQRVTNF
jgi:hypothetical protein